jgi:hypothetical protein
MLEGGGVFLAFQSCGSWTLNLFSSFTRELARRRWYGPVVGWEL